MKVEAVQNHNVQPQFQSLLKNESSQHEEKKIDKKEIAKISTAVLATALAATTITSFVRGKAYSKRLRCMEENFGRQLDTILEPYKKRVNDLTEKLSVERKANSSLKQANQDINAANKRLRQEADDAKNKLNEILDGEGVKGTRTKIYEDLKATTDKAELGYDTMEPPVTGLGQKNVYTDAVDLPARVKTTNRANMRVLDIPEIEPNGKFHFEMPTSDEIKISRVEKSRDFTPRRDQMTNVSESYADSVQWNNDKIARDVLQNFFVLIIIDI